MTDVQKLEGAEPPRLVYGDREIPLRWGGFTKDDLGDMCRFGADQFERGICDLVAFDCLSSEVPKVRAIMAERFPSVAYAFGTGRNVLWRVRAAAEIGLAGRGKVGGA